MPGIVTTKSNRKLYRKAASLWLLPYVYDEDYEEYVLGQSVYDLSAIIGDSIILEHQDGDTESKINEFTGEPVVENTANASYKFTAQCLDLQNVILKALFGAYYNSALDVAAMKRDTPTIYAMIRVRFSDPNTPDLYLPKVGLNSRLLMQQMKTRGSQGNITGTALSHRCAVIESSADQTLCNFSEGDDAEPLYLIDTPVLFVPKDVKPLFLNHRIENISIPETYFDEVRTAMSDDVDCCEHNRVVYDDNQSVYTIISEI